jgi:hypothetical protein
MCSLVASRTSRSGANVGDSAITTLHALRLRDPPYHRLEGTYRESACRFPGAALIRPSHGLAGPSPFSP